MVREARRAHLRLGVLVGEVGDVAALGGREAAGGDVDADAGEARLGLRVNAEGLAALVRGGLLGLLVVKRHGAALVG